MIGTPAADDRRNTELDAALLSELKGVGEQVLEHLLQALGVGDKAAAQALIRGDLEGQLAVFRLVAERPGNSLKQCTEEDLLGFDRDRAGLDLRKVENVGDEVEQIGAGADRKSV